MQVEQKWHRPLQKACWKSKTHMPLAPYNQKPLTGKQNLYMENTSKQKRLPKSSKK
uniref:Uncharacterized protein n=1 Tax=Manihot esculenta TaxID=3983 RepID=A0A2C9UFD0_MANES